MVWGAIIGDVCGSAYEAAAFNGEIHKSKKLPFFIDGTHFTDDSVMTAAVCNIILTGSDIVETFHRYFDMNQYCGFGQLFGEWCLTKNTEPFNSYGNGALMRISPCAYYSSDLNECLRKAYEITNVTHNHEESIRAVKSYISLLWNLKHGKLKKEDVREFLLNNDYDIINTNLEEIRPHYRFDVSCQGSYPQSVLAFVESDSFEDALRNAMSLGGDVDTMMCITGAIAEIYYGIPDQLLDKVKTYLSDELLDVVDSFYDSYCY